LKILRSASSTPTPTRVSRRLDALESRKTSAGQEIEQQLTRKLADRALPPRSIGRRKRAYSIWRKMERKSIGSSSSPTSSVSA
jgi:(p)ppGpp synthase/HD superfamily hydrolase